MRLLKYAFIACVAMVAIAIVTLFACWISWIWVDDPDNLIIIGRVAGTAVALIVAGVLGGRIFADVMEDYE